MKENTRVIHTFIKLIFFNIAMLLMLFIPCSVKASNTEEFAIYQYESEGEQYKGVAVCVDTGDGKISLIDFCTDQKVNSSFAEAITKDNTFPIELAGTYADTLCVWKCQEKDLLQYVSMYQVAYPVKGEQVTAVYFSKDDDGVKIEREQTTLTQGGLRKVDDPNSGYVVLFDVLDNKNYSNFFPGMLENANGECVGVILENGIACPIAYDDNIFNNSTTEEKQVEEQTQKQPEKTRENETEKQSKDQKKTDAQAKDQWEKIGEILGGFIITILFAVFFIRRMLKKNKLKHMSPVEPKPIDPKPVNPKPTEWLDPKPNINVIKPTEPITPEVKPEKEKLFLYIKGGSMAGQAYPIGNDKVMIGRSNKCRIQYPKDYAGVSTIHASVFYLNGKLYLKDEDSSYGTYLKTKVGAKKLEPTQPQELHEGSEFYIAEEKNVIRVVNVAAKNKR